MNNFFFCEILPLFTFKLLRKLNCVCITKLWSFKWLRTLEWLRLKSLSICFHANCLELNIWKFITRLFYSRFQKRAKGHVLLGLVYQHLDLIEKDYFGLQFVENGLTPSPGNSDFVVIMMIFAHDKLYFTHTNPCFPLIWCYM